MENFIVSARKYRPATFDTVVGQYVITTTLKNAIRNKQLAQAFLFCGPRGVGKTTCARILAKTINCENPTSNVEPCNECVSCKTFNESTSFNIHELDAASNNSVDDIRSLVDQVRIPPQMGKYKVYIIDEVHMLSPSAFNAFLKTLEEPPAYAKFILATTEKHKIIPTILSRCQIFDFKRITADDIAKHLKYVAANENVTIEEEALHIIAHKSDGAMRDSLSIFDQMVSMCGSNISYEQVIENLNVLDYDYYFKVVDSMLASDLRQTVLILNEIIEKGFEGQHFINGLADHLRNLMMCRDQQTIRLIETSESVKNRYLLQAKNCSSQFLLAALDLSNKCDVNYRLSNNKRLHLEITLMQICQLGLASKQLSQDTGMPQQASAGTRPVPFQTPVLNTGIPQPAPPQSSATKPTTKPAPQLESANPKEQNPNKEIDNKAEHADALSTTSLNSTAAPSNEIDSSGLVAKETSSEVYQKPSQSGSSNLFEGKPDEYSSINPQGTVRTGSFSIKKAMQNTHLNPENTSSEPQTKRTSEFTLHKLDSAWIEYANHIKNDSLVLYTALVQRKPSFDENYKIDFEVENIVTQNELNERKPLLLSFLRDKLDNDLLDLNVSIAATPLETRKIYTDRDKYEALRATNPAIKNMKDQLGLEFEL